MTFWRPPTCQHPGCTRQGRKHYRLDPRNYSERHLILCIEHGRKHKYAPVTYDHMPAKYAARERL